MRNKNFKGRCTKIALKKSKEVCRTYDPIQYAYANVLEKRDDVVEIRCNVILDGLEIGDYMSDLRQLLACWLNMESMCIRHCR